MGLIAKEMRHYKQTISAMEMQTESFKARMKELQKGCPHEKWEFVVQANAFNEPLWHVTHRCSECDLERTVRTHPICPTHGVELVRTDVSVENDAAEAFAQVSNDAHTRELECLILRCPIDRELHTLFMCGE